MYKDLIIVIVDKYLSEDVMRAAKAAGAKGGTILLGRGVDSKGKKKMFNTFVEPEKEVVLILSKTEETNNIVQLVDSELKLTKGNKGLLLVLDVMSAIG